jgi:hypothetical protein
MPMTQGWDVFSVAALSDIVLPAAPTQKGPKRTDRHTEREMAPHQ